MAGQREQNDSEEKEDPASTVPGPECKSTSRASFALLGASSVVIDLDDDDTCQFNFSSYAEFGVDHLPLACQNHDIALAEMLHGLGPDADIDEASQLLLRHGWDVAAALGEAQTRRSQNSVSCVGRLPPPKRIRTGTERQSTL